MPTYTKRKGLLLLDILVGVAVFAILIGSVIFTLLMSQRSILKSGDKMQATFLAQQALEAVRTMRDNDFDSITTPGTYGIIIQDDVWVLDGTSVTQDGFTVSITLANVDSDVSATANVSWAIGQLREGDVSLSAQYSNWRRITPIGDWSLITHQGQYEDTGVLFNNAVTKDEYLFVTSGIDGEHTGAGLYIFTVANTGDPTRILSAFSLGHPAYDLEIYGDYLIVAEHNSTEIQIYDTTTLPTSLSAVASINVAGSGLVRSIDIVGSTLYVGSRTGTGNPNSIAVYNIADINDINSPGTFDESATYNSVSGVGDNVYVATNIPTSELRIIDAIDTGNPVIHTSSGGAALPDATEATSIKAVQNYALIGRAPSDTVEEIYLFDIGTHSPLSATPLNTQEAGARVNAVDMDEGETYGFIASELSNKEFSIIDIEQFAAGNPTSEIENYDTDTGIGRGVYYSWQNDRVFFLTNDAIHIFKPS